MRLTRREQVINMRAETIVFGPANSVVVLTVRSAAAGGNEVDLEVRRHMSAEAWERWHGPECVQKSTVQLITLSEISSEQAVEQWYTMCKSMLTVGSDMIFKDDPNSLATVGLRLGKGQPWGRSQVTSHAIQRVLDFTIRARTEACWRETI